jgi:hypothetical protein
MDYRLIGLAARRSSLQRHMPRLISSNEEDGQVWLCLEDLTHGLREPAILDLKMGTL